METLYDEAEVFCLRDDDAQPYYAVAVKEDGWLRICTPTWRQRGPADIYARAVNAGTRKPELAY